MQMLARLEADDIIGQHHSQKLFGRRHNREDAGRHERHMQEEADTVLDAERAQSFGERDQMIIMHPDEIVRLQQFGERLGVSPVDGKVAGEILAVEFEQSRLEMQQRPEHRIGEADIKLPVVVLRKIDCRKIELAGFENFSGGCSFGGNLAAPAEPKRALLEDILQSHREAASLRAFRRQGHAI